MTSNQRLNQTLIGRKKPINWQSIINSAIETRRFLHQHPELSWQEINTAKLIRDTLSNLNIKWRACAKTGTLGYLNFNSASSHLPTVALRGDIDALPIYENTQLDWQSKHTGCMHACGHDGHCATLLASAHWLKLNENKLNCRVVLIFQPAEEGGHGAREMINDGALEQVDEIYGWHNWPAIKFGKLLCPDGIVMSGNGSFEITVSGKGGHASQPELCQDPVLAASAITLNLQQIISRRVAPHNSAVVSVTSIEAASGLTVIPEKAKLSGSIRIPNESTKQLVNQLITDISNHTAASYGVTAKVQITERYGATINHVKPAETMRTHWQNLFGTDAIDKETASPIMASEDFSYYLNEIPGAFALIGADDSPAHQAPCHNEKYDFNDSLISQVCQLYSNLVGVPTPTNKEQTPKLESDET